MPADSGQLGDAARQFRECTERAKRLPSDPELLARRPRPGSWSALECLDHLNRSIEGYFGLWHSELSAARQAAGANADSPGPYKLDLWGRLLVWVVNPPPRFKASAPSPFLPPAQLKPAAVILARFFDNQQRILDAIAAADGLPVDRIRIESPFSKRVRYSIWSSFLVNAAHERRHLWQAEQAVAAARSAK